MLRIYKKYYFIKGESVKSLKSKFKENEIIILENTETLSAIIHHRKKKLAEYNHVETKKGINNYLIKKKDYDRFSDTEKDELLNKTYKFGKFLLSKNEKVVPIQQNSSSQVGISFQLIELMHEGEC